MHFDLPDLPYAQDALEPYVSTETLAIHHGRHHKAYIDKTNIMLGNSEASYGSVTEAMLGAHSTGNKSLFRQVAQAWNHDFLWHSMSPTGGHLPSGSLAALVEKKFVGVKGFQESFTEMAMSAFGSAWIWLVAENRDLGLMTTKDAGNPLCYGAVPLLVLDLWEHAYYVDYRNDRLSYVENFLFHLINWKFAEQNFAQFTADFAAA